MLSMFKEKEEGKALHWSMTRVVAFLAAMTLNYAILVMAAKDHVHDIAWPFCVMYIVTLLAVPIMVMFKFLQVWFTSAPAKQLLKKVLAGIEVKASDLGLSGGGGTQSQTVEVKTTTGGGDQSGV